MTIQTSAPTGYATDNELYATRYTQGGRTVYGGAMTPAEITALVKRPDPEANNPGNRKIRPEHAEAFARYFIEHDEWVIPGIILRAQSIFEFDRDETREAPGLQYGIMRYAKKNQGDIHILDSQHRILGFHRAIDKVDEMMSKARNDLATARRVDKGGRAERDAKAEIARLDKVRDRFDRELVSVEIQVTDDMDAYRQMFVDIAENALGITASVKARFDTRNPLNRALPAIFEHPLLAGRVDLEADRLTRKNPYLLTARHVVETERVIMVGYSGRLGPRVKKEMKEAQIARANIDFWTIAASAFPPLKAVELGQLLPDTLRETSMLGSATMLRVLAGVYHELVGPHAWPRANVEKFFTTLAPHLNAPAHANSIWKKHVKPEAFNMDAWSPNQRRQDAQGLVDTIVQWAIIDDPILKEAPEAAPTNEIDPDEGIDFAPLHDTKALEVEVRNEMEDISAAHKARSRSVKKP